MANVTETFTDVALPEPVNRAAMLFAQIGTGLALALFSIYELSQEVRLLRRLTHHE